MTIEDIARELDTTDALSLGRSRELLHDLATEATSGGDPSLGAWLHEMADTFADQAHGARRGMAWERWARSLRTLAPSLHTGPRRVAELAARVVVNG